MQNYFLIHVRFISTCYLTKSNIPSIYKPYKPTSDIFNLQIVFSRINHQCQNLPITQFDFWTYILTKQHLNNLPHVLPGLTLSKSLSFLAPRLKSHTQHEQIYCICNKYYLPQNSQKTSKFDQAKRKNSSKNFKTTDDAKFIKNKE